MQAATAGDQDVLKRIVALLLALAALAERASLRSRPVRCLVLLFLRPAEARARAFIIDLSYDFGAPAYFLENPAPIVGRSGETAADALRLAVAFEMLAAVLDELTMLPPSQWPALNHAGLPRFLLSLEGAFRLWPRLPPAGTYGLAWPAPAYPDTS